MFHWRGISSKAPVGRPRSPRLSCPVPGSLFSALAHISFLHLQKKKALGCTRELNLGRGYIFTKVMNFLLVLSPKPLTLRGALPHYLSLKKELAYSSS